MAKLLFFIAISICYYSSSIGDGVLKSPGKCIEKPRGKTVLTIPNKRSILRKATIKRAKKKIRPNIEKKIFAEAEKKESSKSYGKIIKKIEYKQRNISHLPLSPKTPTTATVLTATINVFDISPISNQVHDKSLKKNLFHSQEIAKKINKSSLHRINDFLKTFNKFGKGKNYKVILKPFHNGLMVDVKL